MDYERLGRRAASVIRKYGKPATLEQVGSSADYTKTFNVAQGRYQWQLNVDPFTIIYVDPATPIQSEGFVVERKSNYSELNRSNIEKNDRLFLLVGTSKPKEHDILIVGVERLHVNTVELVQPGTVTLLYKVATRG